MEIDTSSELLKIMASEYSNVNFILFEDDNLNSYIVREDGRWISKNKKKIENENYAFNISSGEKSLKFSLDLFSNLSKEELIKRGYSVNFSNKAICEDQTPSLEQTGILCNAIKLSLIQAYYYLNN